jgi:hypothetical protein
LKTISQENLFQVHKFQLGTLFITFWFGYQWDAPIKTLGVVVGIGRNRYPFEIATLYGKPLIASAYGSPEARRWI